MKFEVREISSKEACKYIAESEEYRSMMIDGSPEPEDFRLPEIPCWGAFIRKELIAVGAIAPYRDGYLSHFQVSAKYKPLSRDILREFIERTKPATLYARIPVHLRKYINFCKKLKFRETAVLKEAYTVRGEKRDWQELVRP